jgi:hypothetical protein
VPFQKREYRLALGNRHPGVFKRFILLAADRCLHDNSSAWPSFSMVPAYRQCKRRRLGIFGFAYLLAAISSALPPISPMTTTPSVSASF